MDPPPTGPALRHRTTARHRVGPPAQSTRMLLMPVRALGRNDNMAAEVCPCCGKLVNTTKTDVITINPVEFRGYSIISIRVQTRRCICGCVGRTPVLTGQTIWTVPKNLMSDTSANGCSPMVNVNLT